MVYTIDKDTPINMALCAKWVQKHHQSTRRAEQLKLHKAYLGDYDILRQEKPEYKPNNKLTNNYAKYIVDTFCGFMDGKPFTVTSQNEAVQEAVENFDRINTTEFKNYELIKQASIYGSCYELLYQNEEAETRDAVLNPLNTFVVYDDTVEQTPVFGITYRIDSETRELTGEMYTADKVYSFDGVMSQVQRFREVGINPYYTVPLIEYRFNVERQGIFENALSLIDAYNKVLSEKANDVEYFSDAYLVVTGADLIQENKETAKEALERTLRGIRDNRTMWLHGDVAEGNNTPDVKFLGKPEADTTQENLLKRLEDNIFHLSMVANISDESFGASSGIALQYKLLNMRNLAKTAQRNLVLSFKKRYKLYFSFANNISPSLADEWNKLEFNFYENLPVNALEMAQSLATFKGLVSDETALKMAGIDNPMQELKRMEQESAAVFDFQKDDEVDG